MQASRVSVSFVGHFAFCPEETETLDACTQCVSKFVLAQKARALNTVKL